REAQARVGDVDRVGEDRHADRLDRPECRRHHAEDDVEVVDHEVQDNVDVGAALGERREPVTLDEAGLRDEPVEGEHGRIEALEMPGLQDATAPHRELDERLRLFHRRRERLLDQHVDPRVEEVAGDVVVAVRRDRHARTVDPTDERAMIGERRGAERARDGAGAPSVGIDHGDELGAGMRRVLLGMEPAEIADAHDCGPEPPHRSSIMPSTATTAIPARSATAIISSRSRMIVEPASRASARAWTCSRAATVAGPTAGRSKRRSCVGLQTLTRTMSPFASWPARRIVASVPSIPSTAITAPLRTTTLWPMSNCPMTFATRKPNRMSRHSSAVGARAPRTPATGTMSPRYTVEATTAIPSDSSSAATARSTRSSRSWPTRARSAS